MLAGYVIKLYLITLFFKLIIYFGCKYFKCQLCYFFQVSNSSKQNHVRIQFNEKIKKLTEKNTGKNHTEKNLF